MRNALLSAVFVLTAWLAACNDCTAYTDDLFVPTDYPTSHWTKYAADDGCTLPTGTDPVTSGDGATCWTNPEAHAADWSALSCTEACAAVTLGNYPTSCAPMYQDADGHYRIKCTYESCPSYSFTE